MEVPTPFKRLSFQEAINRYGIDKPDTRFGMELGDFTEEFRGSKFKVFGEAVTTGGVVKAVNAKGLAGATQGQMDALTEIAKRASPGARVASELPTVAAYYAQRVNRADLVCVELSDPSELGKLAPGDFVIDGRGRTYFSNQAMLSRLRQASRPAFSIAVGTTPAADVYGLDQKSLAALRGQLLQNRER